MDIQDLINLEKNIHVSQNDLQKCISELSTRYPLKTIIKILKSKEFVDDILSVKTDDDIFPKYYKIVNKDENFKLPSEEEISTEWEKMKAREKLKSEINEYIPVYIKLKQLFFNETPTINKDDWLNNFDFYKRYTEDMLNYYTKIEKKENPPIENKKNKIRPKNPVEERWDYNYKKKQVIKIARRPIPKSDTKRIKEEYKRYKAKHPESTMTLDEYYEKKKEKRENEEKEKQLKLKEKEQEARKKRDEENKKRKEYLTSIEYKKALRMNPDLTLERFTSKTYNPRSFVEKAPQYDISDDENSSDEQNGPDSEDEASHLLEIFKNIPEENDNSEPISEPINKQPTIKKRKQLCPLLLAGIRCDKIASGCKYLHPPECHFGINCGKINWIFGGNYTNRNLTDICKRIHRHESMKENTKESIESYLKRMNIKYEKKNKVIKIKY